MKDKITLRIDKDVLDTVKTLAESDDRSISNLVNRVLSDYVAAQKAITSSNQRNVDWQ